MFAKCSQFFAAIPSSALLTWVYLGCACVFEVIWALSLKLTDGFTHAGWTAATVPLALLSTGFLALAMKGLPMGTAYAIWTGIGTVGTVLIGTLCFREQTDAIRLLCIALIVAGVLGLKLAQSH